LAVLAAAQKVGKAAGKHCFDSAEVTMRIGQGFQFLALSSDAGLMGRAARKEFGAVDFSGGAGGSGERASGSLY
jgi:2-keto-3-deoxy-L-rhamnonate aldolase RhmA